MYPILFQIRGFTLYTHGAMAVLGIISATLLIFLLANKRRLDTSSLFDNTVYTVFFGIVGARLTYAALYPEQFESFKQVVLIWNGGLVSYGGFIVGGAALTIILKIQKQPIMRWLDLFGVGLPLGLFFGRLGDVLAGEYFGVPNPGNSSFDHQIPVTLYESVWNFFIFILLLFTFRKISAKLSDGATMVLSIALYTLGRFVIDFWRDSSPLLLDLNASQIASLIIFLTALIWFILLAAGRKKGIL